MDDRPASEERSDGKPSHVKVLYVLGWGRSGTTILDAVAGSIDGFFTTGELGAIWDAGILHGSPCGCGRPLMECPVWSAVLHRALGSRDTWRARASEMASLEARLMRERYTLRLLAHMGKRRPRPPDLERYLEIAGATYGAIASTTGARVIVESSKAPTYGIALELLAGVEPYFLHLVRDPRASAFSFRRNKMQPGAGGPEPMRRMGPIRSTARWLARNVLAEAVGKRSHRYRVIRYEDLARDPRRILDDIVAFVGEPGAELPLRGERTALLEPNHSVSGNPVRSATGPIEIVPDDVWRQEQGRWDRVAATVVALPRLIRYGYPLVRGDVR